MTQQKDKQSRTTRWRKPVVPRVEQHAATRAEVREVTKDNILISRDRRSLGRKLASLMLTYGASDEQLQSLDTTTSTHFSVVEKSILVIESVNTLYELASACIYAKLALRELEHHEELEAADRLLTRLYEIVPQKYVEIRFLTKSADANDLDWSAIKAFL